MPAANGDTIGPGGGDTYPDFVSFWADLPASLSENWDIELTGDTAADDLTLTTSTNFNGFTIRIFTQEANRGNGGPDLPAFVLTTNGGMGIGSTSTVVLLELDGVGIEAEGISGPAFRDAGGAGWAQTATITLRDGYVVNDSSRGVFDLDSAATKGTLTLENMTVVQTGSANFTADFRGWAPTVKNCMFDHAGASPDIGVLGDGGTWYSNGSFASGGSPSRDLWFSFSGETGDYNYSQDGTATDGSFAGSNNVANVAITEDATATGWIVEGISTHDYRLKAATSGTNQAVDGGDASNSTASDQIGTARSTPDAGPFELTAGTTVTFAGTMASVSAISGDFAVSRSLSGTATAVTALSASLDVTRNFSGSVDSASNLSAVLSNTRRFSGTMASAAVLSGDFVAQRLFSGTMTANSGFAGGLTVGIPEETTTVRRGKGFLRNVGRMLH